MPNTRTNPIPSRLAQARRETGLTQEQAADRSGLSRTSIARYEGGTVGPSPVALNMLATIYGKPAEWFFGEEEEPEATPEEDDIDIMDPSLSLFFRGEWDEFTEAEREFVKGMIRQSRELLRKRREAGG